MMFHEKKPIFIEDSHSSWPLGEFMINWLGFLSVNQQKIIAGDNHINDALLR